MKRFLPLFAILLISNLGFSQGFSISPSDSVHLDVQIGGYYTATIDLPFTSTPNDTVYIGWELISVETPAGSNWDYSYCDYTSCYTANVTASTMTPIMDGQMAFFKVNVIPDTPGFARFKVKVFNIDDPMNFTVLTFTFNGVLSLPENNTDDYSIYPNPTVDGLVNVSAPGDVKSITIIGTNGNVFYHSDSAQEQMMVNVSNLSPGIYFVQFTNSNGGSSNQKLVVR